MNLFKSCITVIITILMFSCSSKETQDKALSKSENKELVKALVINSFEDILSDLNTENMSKYYTKDFLLLEDGMLWNNDTLVNILNRVRTSKTIPKRTNNLEFIAIKIADSTAWVAYQNYATFTVGDSIVRKVHWLESAHAILTKEGWRLEMLHSTPVRK